ncbi:MAG TPA: 2-dehydropantoate 2-reductase [Myxococcales bacterium]|nr:2-dehydropantoate 2-reductase [Myxococcales bacterium]
MKIAMLGSGGVGGYYGARLAQAGNEVTFVARGKHAAAMREHGLRIRSEAGDAHLQPARVVENTADAGAQDLVVVAVKLWDSEAAAQSAKPMVGPQTTVVSLQNGVDKDDVLAAAVGRERVIGGVTHIGATIAEPGVIAHTGRLARVTIGELDGARSERVECIAGAFRKAGVETVVSDDIRRATWEKFVFLTAISGLTALTRRPIGEVRSNPATRAMLLEAFEEAARVARAEGAEIAADFAQKQLAAADNFPPAMLSSMAQDLLRKNRLELEWLSGAVVRRAQKHGIDVPAHRHVYAGLVLHAG